MRVGLFTYGMRDELTGIGRYARSLSYALQDVDPNLQFWLLNPYPDSPLPWYRDFPTCSVPQLSRLPAVLTLGSPLLARIAARLRLDVLHDPCGIAPFAAPRLGVGRVVTVHDAVPLVMPEAQQFLTRLVFRTLVPASRWTADAVLTDSQVSARDLTERAGLPEELVRVIYPGVEMPTPSEIERWRREAAGLDSRFGIRPPYLLHVGGLNPRKNIERLLEAFVRLTHVIPEAQLVLAGPPTWGAAEVIRRATMNPEVVQTGFVDDETLHRLYASAAAVVSPSLYEGFGFPVIEAMAHGTPVICSNRSSLLEVAGNACDLVDPVDVPAMTAVMAHCLEDTAHRAELASRGRRRALAFTWERTAMETLSVYREVMERRL